MKTSLFVIASALFINCAPAQAVQITNYFDDLSSVPANGLDHEGILWGYTLGGVASPAGLYGVAFPSDSLIASTVLAGPAASQTTPSLSGLLSLNFDGPTDLLSFAIALDSAAGDSFELQLFDGGGNPGTPLTINTAVNPACDLNSGLCFSEAQYTYSGTSLISAVQLDFTNTQADLFALSTLVYDEAPEPGSVWLSLFGLAVIIAAVGRKLRVPGESPKFR